MAKRTNDLTEFARPIADELASRMGTLKHVLSAGVMALNDLPAERREYYMAVAVGKKLNPKPLSEIPSEKEIYADLRNLADLVQAIDAKIKRSEAAKQKKNGRRRRRAID
jgi:hypothetical protein